MNEEHIIAELKKQNKQVFAQLVDMYKNRIFSMAYKYTNDYIESQDLAQEIFLKVYKEIKGFKGNSKLSTWIYRVGVNTCLDWKRKKSKTKLTSFDVLDEYLDRMQIEELRDTDKEPERKVIDLEKHKEIHKTIYEMSDIYKNVVIMYHFNDMSYEEIAEALDIPKKTVETRLYRARKILKNQLKKLDVEVMKNEV
ncbi:RNA polymerase sigma factor [Sporosalibacterium faouarense]|uniref:RNA polymerase sigma factor n=1 Tax=Sporosalibacterium faouarense TaxID=516123 RepID=UPI00141D0CE1|nr:sigma-70 family RNA polymerase sigma factor [Sporosalibacterium faouarense]MTI49499.1 sigma-70 family RNA polymerase sigma factor [Bacillota bacterium]